MGTTSIGFSFRINDLGRVATVTNAENIRAKILQVLLTSPGERVQLPEFGCGLRELVFDPNNEILAATTEFSVTKALQQWLADDIILQSVDISSRAGDAQIPEGEIQVEVVYLLRESLEPGKVKIAF